METTDTRFAELVRAASALAASRRHDLETCEEWDALQHALLGLEVPPPTFRSGALVRTVTLAIGENEEHACDVDDLEQVAFAIEDAKGQWFVVDEVAIGSRREWTTAHLAVAFLHERGLVRHEGVGHRLRAGADFSVEAALAEFAVAQMGAARKHGAKE